MKKLLLIIFFTYFSSILIAQDEFPNSDYWALDAGFGTSSILVDGVSFNLFIEPKLSITHKLMAGGRFGMNYSFEDDSRDIFTLETLVFLRWNFLRLGNPDNTINIYAQGGLGVLAAYRGNSSNPFGDETMTRGSILAEGAIGITIPLTERWHIEGQFRGGYPHMTGFSVAAGYKFPIRHRTDYRTVTRTLLETRTQFIELPPEEIVKMITIAAVEYIIFGPDMTRYNVNIDHDAMALNDLILNHTAEVLRDNPLFRVRIEGHANPIDLSTPAEVSELERVSTERTREVARLLMERGVREEQIVTVSFGGTRVVASDHDHRNMNRRVEMIIIDINTEQ